MGLLFWRRDPDDDQAAAGGPRLLLATFGRLVWYFPATDSHRVVHKGRGKYYGMAPEAGAGEPPRRLWVVSRPNQAADDRLLLIDHLRGKTVRKVRLASRDTHQAVRHGDTLWVTDTFRGNVLTYDLASLELTRTYDVFTHENHVNSVLVDGDGFLALCHNKGKSWMARVDTGTGRIVDEYPDVGENSHDVVAWEDSFLICDSRGGGLVCVERESKRCRTLYAAEGHFSKGLVVVGGVAYFCVSPAATRAERTSVNCDLVAYDLHRDELLWRRRLETGGLVNAITSSDALAPAAGGGAVGPSGRDTTA